MAGICQKTGYHWETDLIGQDDFASIQSTLERFRNIGFIDGN